MKYLIILILIFTVPAIAQAGQCTNSCQHKEGTCSSCQAKKLQAAKPKVPDCDKLLENLQSCTPYKCSRYDFESPDFKITHEILGLDGNGKCKTRENMPSGKFFRCYHTPETKAATIKMIGKRLAEDSEIDSKGQQIMQDAWQNNICLISAV